MGTLLLSNAEILECAALSDKQCKSRKNNVAPHVAHQSATVNGAQKEKGINGGAGCSNPKCFHNSIIAVSNR
jgi:hypothetical protein